MTLRMRLVVALVGLLAVGLVAFGFVTNRLYANSEYERLDEQLDDAVAPVTVELDVQAGLSVDDAPGDEAPPPEGPGGPLGELSLYAALIDADGAILAERHPETDVRPALPDLPEQIRLRPARPELFLTVGSVGGTTRWRVLVTVPRGFPRAPDHVVVLAAPTTTVEESLERLVVVEAVAGAGLLAALAVGSWLILRRGLRPLERMAATARTITAGDLSVRVQPADERTEVGQLGLALNTMLGRLEEAFRERDATEQRLRQFLADASHELRTPLTSIQGFAELFRLGADLDEDDLALTMRRIEEETVRMRLLVDDLLLLARLDRTRPAERVPVDLAVLAADACSDAVVADRDRSVTLDAPAPVVVQGDADHLRQAIGNLVTNALRHTPAVTAVEVSARSDDGSGVVVVRDHGAGLDVAGLEHAFDRFWQANPARSAAGAGLGLAIVAAIAAEHGGTATAANAPGGGARFVLAIPAIPAVPAEADAVGG